ncbi:MAG: hypothetical protein ACREU8_01785 [Gammaproteobacteria bacterium]
MPTLSNATLSIPLVSGTSKRMVTATVKVAFTTEEKTILADHPELRYRLRCRLYGIDGEGINGVGEDSGQSTGDNDYLFSLDGKWVREDGTYTLPTKEVASSALDEDDQYQDEIAGRFSCDPNISLSSAPRKWSGIVRGSF